MEVIPSFPSFPAEHQQATCEEYLSSSSICVSGPEKTKQTIRSTCEGHVCEKKKRLRAKAPNLGRCSEKDRCLERRLFLWKGSLARLRFPDLSTLFRLFPPLFQVFRPCLALQDELCPRNSKKGRSLEKWCFMKKQLFLEKTVKQHANGFTGSDILFPFYTNREIQHILSKWKGLEFTAILQLQYYGNTLAI